VFIEGALVAGEFQTPHPFFAANRALIREVEDLEHRARRPDVLVDDRVLHAWYAERVPEDVLDARSFDHWYRDAAHADPQLLFLTKEELMRHGAESVTEALFPRQVRMGEATFPLAYRFEPGHPLDGVTMNVPLALLNQVADAAVDWLVPGMVRDKIAWTLKALPKRVRTQLVPVPEHVTRFLETAKPGERPIREAVLAYASRVVGERLDDAIWSKDDLPAHLAMNLRIVDDAKRELAMGRDPAELRKRLGEAASLTLAQAQPGMEREGIKGWDFGELPGEVSFRRGNQSLTGYPGLVDDGESVSIRLFDARDKAAGAHREGVKRLLGFELREQLKNLDRSITSRNALLLRFVPAIAAEKVKDDLVTAIVDRAFIGEDEPPRTARAFEEQKKRAKARLPAVGEAATRHAAAIADANQQLIQALAQASALGRIANEVRVLRERLVHPGFLSRTPWERLEHVPRYLKGYALRLQKYRASPERDQRHGPTVAGLWNLYEARAAADRDAGRTDAKLEEFRWMIEELRVSLFAQELRTPMPVSSKRLHKFWDEHLR
jgi:ATP-dependent helicase HrpA